MDYEPWSYAAVDCVNWQAEGSFRRSALEYHYGDDGTVVETAAETGTAAGGVMLESTNTTVMTNQTNGEVNEFTDEKTYENGYMMLTNGPSDVQWTPFAGPGSTKPDPDWIFW